MLFELEGYEGYLSLTELALWCKISDKLSYIVLYLKWTERICIFFFWQSSLLAVRLRTTCLLFKKIWHYYLIPWGLYHKQRDEYLKHLLEVCGLRKGNNMCVRFFAILCCNWFNNLLTKCEGNCKFWFWVNDCHSMISEYQPFDF